MADVSDDDADLTPDSDDSDYDARSSRPSTRSSRPGTRQTEREKEREMAEHEQEQNEALKVIIPDYIAYETKPWEDVAALVPTLHSFIVLLCIFWASLFAVVVGRVTV